MGKSSNGALGVSASFGGANGINAHVGADVAGSGGLASVGVDASVGGPGGLAANHDTSVAGRSGMVDSNTTASLGGHNASTPVSVLMAAAASHSSA